MTKRGVRCSLIEKALNVAHHAHGVGTVSVELDHFSVLVDEELGEVPLDLGIGSLRGKAGIQRADVLALDVNLGKHWELDSVVACNPVLDLRLGPGLLRTKLVAWVRQDLQSSASIRLVHLLVLAVMLVGEASLAGHVDHDDGLRTISQVANSYFIFFSDATHRDVEKGSAHK